MLISLILFFVQVCQVAGVEGLPAGSKHTSFSVDSSGNVVTSYGIIMGPDSYARYPFFLFILNGN